MIDNETERRRILVIEDNKADQSVYRRTLREFDLDPVPGANGAGVGEGGRIRHGWTRTNGVQIVADDVGEDEREQSCRLSQTREFAAFDGREVLAHAVDVVNCGSAFEQRTSDRLFLG